MTEKITSTVGPIKVLIADDSAVFRKLVEETLTAERYVLVFARSGHEAIQIFETHHPALVIVDWVMPDLTGIEICQHIRSKSQAAYTYTIILTGMSDKEKRRRQASGRSRRLLNEAISCPGIRGPSGSRRQNN